MDCTFDRYGHCGVSCSMRAGRVVVVCQIFYLVRILVALALGVGWYTCGWPNTAASDGLS